MGESSETAVRAAAGPGKHAGQLCQQDVSQTFWRSSTLHERAGSDGDMRNPVVVFHLPRLQSVDEHVKGFGERGWRRLTVLEKGIDSDACALGTPVDAPSCIADFLSKYGGTGHN